MSQEPDYIVYQPPSPSVGGGPAEGVAPRPLTEGLWQQEALSILQMYADGERFSPLKPGPGEPTA